MRSSTASTGTCCATPDSGSSCISRHRADAAAARFGGSRPRCCIRRRRSATTAATATVTTCFGVSRLTPLKRFDLVLRALAEPTARELRVRHCRRRRRIERADAAARRRSARDRVTFVGRLDEAALLDHLRALPGGVLPPLDEDYGFVTVEAFASRQAGHYLHRQRRAGRARRDGETGCVAAPTPEALAEAMRRLMDDRDLAARMGTAGLRAARAR